MILLEGTLFSEIFMEKKISSRQINVYDFQE